MARLKLRLFILAVCAIIATVMSNGTLAYYSVVGTATNVVTSGNIKLAIHETQGDGTPYPEDAVVVLPGQTVSKRVAVENVCGHPFYLRVKLINSIDRAEVDPDDFLDIDINETYWTVKDDGYIYYNEVLEPGDITEPVFTEVHIRGDKVDNSYIGNLLSLTVNAYAVQQENNPAEHPWDAAGWPYDEGGGQ